MGRTLFAKIWDAHAVAAREDGASLLWVDRHLVHEGSFHGFGKLAAGGRQLRRPDLTFGFADHYVPSHSRRRPIGDPEAAGLVATLRANAALHGFRHFDIDDPDQGIVHVAGPEQGLTLPGSVLVCGDSHSSTHGAFGALGFGIGASEVAHVLATQALWQRRPGTLRVSIEGELHAQVTAKDLALAVVARIGAAGASGRVIEYAGAAVRALGMEGRMTLCNMSIEAGGRAGMVAPDQVTFAYLAGRRFAPKGADWEAAMAAWQRLPTDADALFDVEVGIDAAAVAPMVTWGTSPDSAVAIDGVVPGDAAPLSPDYMGLAAGTPLLGLAIDRVFIGSCTNGRLSDLRAAAAVLAGRRARVPGLVVAGSAAVKRAAEAEGLDRIFVQAGLVWGEPGCSMCVGINGDLVPPGARCASTSNRNFAGRQGPGARTHLMSPAMAAAAAVAGAIADVRRLA